jgi:hypothetical protein
MNLKVMKVVMMRITMNKRKMLKIRKNKIKMRVKPYLKNHKKNEKLFKNIDQID